MRYDRFWCWRKNVLEIQSNHMNISVVYLDQTRGVKGGGGRSFRENRWTLNSKLLACQLTNWAPNDLKVLSPSEPMVKDDNPFSYFPKWISITLPPSAVPYFRVLSVSRKAVNDDSPLTKNSENGMGWPTDSAALIIARPLFEGSFLNENLIYITAIWRLWCNSTEALQ